MLAPANYCFLHQELCFFCLFTARKKSCTFNVRYYPRFFGILKLYWPPKHLWKTLHTLVHSAHDLWGNVMFTVNGDIMDMQQR